MLTHPFQYEDGTWGVADLETGVEFHLNSNGVVEGSQTADGQPLPVDPDRFLYQDGAFVDMNQPIAQPAAQPAYDAERLAGLDARLAAAEQQAGLAPAPEPQQPDEDAERRRTADMYADQVQQIEREQGRAFTRAELDRIQTHARQNLQATGNLNVWGAVYDAGVHDLDTDQGRQDFMTERIQDGLGDPEPLGVYDADSHEERVAYYRDRVRGVAEPADLIKWNDFPEDEPDSAEADAAAT